MDSPGDSNRNCRCVLRDDLRHTTAVEGLAAPGSVGGWRVCVGAVLGGASGAASGAFSVRDRFVCDVPPGCTPPPVLAVPGELPTWVEVAVASYVPVAHQLWESGCCVVESGPDRFVDAVGAACAASASNEPLLVVVPERAPPPDTGAGTSDDHRRGHRTVRCGVPLRGELWMRVGERVRSDQDGLVRAHRAAACFPVHNRRAPVVALMAAPPHPSCGSDRYGRRGGCAVAGGMPLRGEFRRLRCEVIDTRLDAQPSADRAAVTGSSEVDDGAIEVMAPYAPPPHDGAGAGQDHLRRHRAVACRVPLGCFLRMRVREAGGARKWLPPCTVRAPRRW